MKSRREPGEAEVNLALKAFKNVFVKDYVASGKGFSPPQMSSALLLIASHCLIDAAPKSLVKIRGKLPDASKRFTDDDLLSICLWLQEMLLSFCPLGIGQALPPPDLAAVKMVRELLPEICWRSLSKSVSSIGFTYEILGLAARKKALRATQTANKELNLEQLIAFTQLYTPDWVVDFLIANTLVPLLKADIKKDSFIVSRYSDWLFKQPSNAPAKQDVQDLKLIDPACGSGQFLLSAFDLFYCCYRTAGIEPAQAAKMVLANNIFGADVDIKAIWTTSLGLLVKSLLVSENLDTRLTNLCLSVTREQEGNLLGSISRAWLKHPKHILNKSYDVVVTNPPYIGRKSLSRELKLSLKRDYPRCSADICAAFLERSMEMLSPGGRMGIITQSSLLALPSYQDLRQHLVTRYQFDSVIQCGTGVFPRANGEKIDSVLLVAEAPADKHKPASFVTTTSDLRALANHFMSLQEKQYKSDELKKAIAGLEKRNGHKEQSISGVQKQIDNLANRIMQSLTNAPALKSEAEVKQGLATTDNERFVRYYWDVAQEDLGTVWVPYMKGAGSERWYSENNYVVKWGKDGAEIKQAVIEAYPYLKGKSSWVVKNEQFYFRPGLCFSFINKHHLAVRRLPAGCIFDVASSAIFPKDGEENFLFAYLNSSLLSTIANLINPTINLQVGDVKRLPVLTLPHTVKEELSRLAKLCYEKKRELNSLVSNDFSLPLANGDKYKTNGFVSYLAGLRDRHAKLCAELATTEDQIDELVSSSFVRLGYLQAQDLRDLCRVRNDTAPRARYQIDSLNDRRALAARVLAQAVADLMLFNQKEQVTILPLLSSTSISEALGLNKESQVYLEEMLEMSIAGYFEKSKVSDLGKQARSVSRYFSVRLPESSGLMFLSARSMKSLMSSFRQNGNGHLAIGMKLIEPDYLNSAGIRGSIDYAKAIAEANAVLKRAQATLSKKVDWTSSDLSKTLIAS